MLKRHEKTETGLISFFPAGKSEGGIQVFGKNKKKQSHGSIESRIAKIRALSAADEKAKKKKKSEYTDSRFNQLLNYLNDDAPECRIAAVEELSKTSKDVAFTHISHLLGSETDERVIKAMRASLSSIRENMRREQSEKA